MARRALIVGIDTYNSGNNLNACVADAKAMAELLSRHKDGEKNFDCMVWLDKTDDGSAITRPKLRAALTELFNFDGDVLLYFSGHGFLSKTGGLLCTSDATCRADVNQQVTASMRVEKTSPWKKQHRASQASERAMLRSA